MYSRDPTDDTIEVASKSWQRMKDAAIKAGYREGIEDGSQSVFQDGFDKGYETAFNNAFQLGRCKGLSVALPETTEHPRHMQKLIDGAKRGACYLCEETNDSYLNEVNGGTSAFESLVNKQKEHSRKAVKDLQEYLKPLLEECQIQVNFQH